MALQFLYDGYFAGTVGIGTIAPAAQLEIITTRTGTPSSDTNIKVTDDTAQAADVGGSINFTGKYTDAGAYLSGSPFIRASKKNATTGDYGYGLKFGVRGSGSATSNVAMTIDSAGDVGIGTGSPGTKLEIKNPDTSGSAARTVVTRQLTLNANGGNNLQPYEGFGTGIIFEGYDYAGGGGTSGPRDYAYIDSIIENSGSTPVDFRSQLKFYTNPGGSNTQTPTPKMVIEGGGNVGIGTDSPGYKLEIDTNGVHDGIKIRGANAPGLTLQDDSSASTSSILIQSTTAAQGNLRISADENNVSTTATIEFKVSGSDKMRILANGNVGIGTIDPQSKLQVDGGIQMADDTDTAVVGKVGTMRYRTGTEYVEVTGTELVTNGDFATDTVWVKSTTQWTISGGKANFAGASTSALYQSITLTSGVVYRVRFNVSGSSGSGAYIWIGNSGGSVNYLGGTYKFYADGDFEEIFTMPSNQTTFAFYSQVSSSSFSMDNVTLMEVTEEDASYADMCMQTGASAYEWVNIVRNTY